jgi:hypothetical protein
MLVTFQASELARRQPNRFGRAVSIKHLLFHHTAHGISQPILANLAIPKRRGKNSSRGRRDGLFFDASKSGAAAGYIAFGPSPLRSVAPKKEYDMDWNAIFFAVALPFFIFGAVGLGIYVQRLPG